MPPVFCPFSTTICIQKSVAKQFFKNLTRTSGVSQKVNPKTLIVHYSKPLITKGKDIGDDRKDL